MSTEDTTEPPATGPIAWMSRNSVAANLLMLVVVLAGLFGTLRVKQEVFPEFDLDIVSVTVPYPGASPEEVEQGIVLAIEEAVRSVDGVKRVNAVANEGSGTVLVELLIGADSDKVLADVKTSVDRISSFPEEAERPSVSLASRRSQVVSLVVSGDQDLSTLHAIAEDARARLLSHSDITQVELQGVPPLEVAIEVPQETLESYGFTLDQVAQQVRAASLELPGGSLKTDGGELLVRVADRRRAGHEFEDIILRGTATGSDVRLGDIADIQDGYADVDLFSYYNGHPAVRVISYRIGDETPQRVAAATREVIDDLRSDLPENIQLAVWDDDSELLADRIDLLVRNARLGLVLVFLILTLFLDLRLALWVGLGIPISILGALALMPAVGVSINMISLFAFIVTLGMVVDDAIVVGENIYDKEQSGIPRGRAAVEGAQEMIVPVTFSILTTIVAFSPMLVVPGVMGKIFRILPILVILVLVFSWLESFFVLPAHLGHDQSWFSRLMPAPVHWVLRQVERVRAPVSAGLDRFNARIYRPVLEVLLAQRYVTAASGAAMIVVAIGIVGAGIVPFSFFPKLEGDLVKVTARLPYGTPLARTEAVQKLLEQSAGETAAVVGQEGDVTGMYTTLGALVGGGGPGGNTSENGSHLLTVELQLVPTGERTFTSKDFTDAWKAQTPPLVGVEALVFQSSVGPGAGAAVDVLLSHPDTAVLAEASNELFTTLGTYPSLTDLENSYASGKPQLDFHLTPAASTLGLTGSDLARQLRSAFFGAEALREQRGRNEIKVMVRLPENQRDSEYHLERLQVRTPQGGLVPLSHVAAFDRGRAPTVISREDGDRVVDVKAELAPGVASSREVLSSLQQEVFPRLKEDYPGLSVELAGEQREQSDTFASLGLNYLLAMTLMYVMLAVPFRSYTQPAIVMAAIPMGIVGAVGGHLIMGYELSVISVFGIVALSGVVVNDSLVLIDATNQRRNEGASAWDSVVYGGTRRLRPILLTSLTTFFGLAPMILETSVQARFLIPMAISLGFGVLFGTVVILLLVPCLYLIVEDLNTFVHRVFVGAPTLSTDPGPGQESSSTP